MPSPNPPGRRMAGRITLAAVSLAFAALLAPVPVGPGVGEAKAATVCGAAEPINGIDVSKYQGVIDWPTVAASGIRFGIARIADGLTFRDAFFEANYAGMLANGITPGAYLFWEPAQDPVAQANLVVAALDRVGFDIGDLPPTLDVEVTGGVPSGTIAERLRTTITAIESAIGVKPLIYTSPKFWNQVLGSGAFADLPLWIAHWRVACPSTPVGWSTWSLWQTTSAGTVPGIVGPVDMNQAAGPALPVYTGAPIFASLPDVEVRGAGPTPVTWSARAIGYQGAPLAATCNPASGSTFRPGTTVVTCAAGNLFGYATASFEVTIRIPPPAVLASPPPTEIRTTATGPAGAQVSWEPVTATDDLGRSIPLGCLPGVGSVFPIGQTLVTCQGTDALGRAVGASFMVSVAQRFNRLAPR